MARKRSVKTVMRELNKFPTADKLALFFELEDIKGERFSAHYCPVAIYLKRETKDDKLAVSFQSVFRMDENSAKNIVVFSPVVRLFVKNFDINKYPKLVVR
jgi:hypothetical protein